MCSTENCRSDDRIPSPFFSTRKSSGDISSHDEKSDEETKEISIDVERIVSISIRRCRSFSSSFSKFFLTKSAEIIGLLFSPLSLIFVDFLRKGFVKKKKKRKRRFRLRLIRSVDFHSVQRETNSIKRRIFSPEYRSIEERVRLDRMTFVNDSIRMWNECRHAEDFH